MGPRTETRGTAFALAGAALALIARAVLKVEASGAVPADEFPPAIPIYHAMPWVLWTGLVLLAVGAWRIIRSRRARGEDHRGPDRLDLRPRSLLRAAFVMGGILTGCTLALALVESYVFTRRFVPELVTDEQIAAYRWELGRLATAVGAQLALVGAVGLVVLRGVIRLSGPARQTKACAFGVGIGTALTLLALFQITLSTELTELGLWLEVVGAAVAIGGLITLVAARRLATVTARTGDDLPDTP